METCLDRERLIVYPRIFLALYLVIGAWWFSTGQGLLDRGGKPLGGDFVTFYAASQLVNRGEAAVAFDLARLHAVEQAVIGAPIERLAWHYPPPTLLAVAPLSWVPFLPSLALVTLASLGLLLALVRSVDRSPVTLGLVLAFPGLFQNLIHGQNGCLSLALLGGSLLLLERRPWLAGICAGAMIYKPHLAPVLAVALVAGGHGRSVLALIATALTLAGLSWLVLGPAPWVAFVDNIAFAQALLYEGGLPWKKMPSVSAGLLLAGVAAGPARVIQAVWSLGVAALVAAIWRRQGPFELRASAVLIGALAASPFAFEYDLVILALPLTWLWVLRDRPEGLPSGWWVLTWLTPVVSPALAGLTGVQLAPLVLLGLLLALWDRTRASSLVAVDPAGAGTG